jgi:hypothetical protein
MIWYLFMKFGVNYGNSMPVNIGGGSERGDKIVFIFRVFSLQISVKYGVKFDFVIFKFQ